MAYTLNGTSLGVVRAVRFGTMERPFTMGMPFMDSNDTLVYSFEGVERKITLMGIFTGTKTQIDTFIDAIHALEDGQQGAGTGYTLASGATDLPNSLSIKVHLEDFSFNWVIDSPLTIDYTLKMIERA